MSLTKRFKTDSDYEKNGFPLKFPPNDDGTVPVFYVARQSAVNAGYQKALEKALAPHRNEARLGLLTEEQDKAIMREVFVDGKILVGWDNVLAEDVGIEIATHADEILSKIQPKAPFTRANALQLLANLPELHNVLVGASQNLANYLAANREDTAKN